MLTAPFATVELAFILVAFMSGAWGPRPCPTELHRSVYVTTDEPRVSDEQKGPPQVYDLAKITDSEAKKLNGKRIVARMRLSRVVKVNSSGQVICTTERNGVHSLIVFTNVKSETLKEGEEYFAEGVFRIVISKSPEMVPLRLFEAKLVKR